MYFHYKHVKYEVLETSTQLKDSPAFIRIPGEREPVVVSEWVGTRPWKILPKIDYTKSQTAQQNEAAMPTRTVDAVAASFFDSSLVFKVHTKIEDLTREAVHCRVHVNDMLCHTEKAFHQELISLLATPALWPSLTVVGYKIVGYIAPHEIVVKVAVKSITRLKKRRVQH